MPLLNLPAYNLVTTTFLLSLSIVTLLGVSLSQGQYNYDFSQQPRTLQPQIVIQPQPQPQPRPQTQPQQQPRPQVQQVAPKPPAQQLRSPCPRAIKMNTNYLFRGSLHFICLQAIGGGRTQLEVIQYPKQERIMSMVVSEPDVDQLASFVDESGTLRILLARPNRYNGTSMYSIDREGQIINETHTINTQFVSALSIWRMELNLEWQLAIANQPTYNIDLTAIDSHRHHVPDPKPMISILSWRTTYFDQYQMIQLPHDGRVNKLEPMHINGQEFLIVAMEPSGGSAGGANQLNGRLLTASVDSLIYKLDFSDGSLKWAQYQNLSTQVAVDAKSFQIRHQHSLQQDYYIALIGQLRETPRAGEAEEELMRFRYKNLSNRSRNSIYSVSDEFEQPFGLIIYKYFGDQFRRTEHLLPAPGAMKLDTITYGSGDSYVIIALLLAGSNQVNLYIFDGLTLKQVPGPNGVTRPTSQPNYLGYPTIRQRSSMENSANLHLFLAPHLGGADEYNGTIYPQKRTLMDDPQQLNDIGSQFLPVLAISAAQENIEAILNNNNENENSVGDSETVYQIPIDSLISDGNSDNVKSNADSQQADLGHSKRNFVGFAGTENLLGWCKSKINDLLADDFITLAQRLMALPRIDQASPIELVGNLIVEDNLHVSNLLYARQVEERRELQQNLILESPPFLNSQTFELIQQAHKDIRAMEQQVNRILVDDGSEQVIFNPLIFDSLILECSPNLGQFDPRFFHSSVNNQACPYIDEILTPRLNARNISNIRQKALLTGRPMEIFGDVRFEHLVLRGKVKIMDSLNGIHVDDIVFKRGPPNGGPIVGHKTFHSLYSSSRLSVANWDGFVVDRNNYLTSTGNQRIEANLRFSQVVVDHPPYMGINVSSRIELLNGIHLDTHLDQIAVANDNNRFEVPLYFDELILNGPVKLTSGSELSHIDVENLWLNTMFKHSFQNITAPMQFNGLVHISYGGDLLVDGPINGINFRPETILMRNHPQFTFTNQIIFEGDVSVGGNLILHKALNGIQVTINPSTGQEELAILYNGGTQQITGDKVFHEVHLGGSTIIRGHINGNLNITQLSRMANLVGDHHRFREVRLKARKGDGRYQVAPGVRVQIESTINGIQVKNMCSMANQLALLTQQSYKRLRFDHITRFKSLRCASINGFSNLTNSFLTRSGNQFINGTLKLLNGVIFNSSISIHSTLNNMQVAPLAGAIARTVNETRSGHKDVHGDLVLDELFVDKVNDLNLANILLTRADEPQVIRAPMIFDHLDIENVLVIGKNLLISNSFNNLNVSDILTNTLQYDTPQLVYNRVELGTLQLLANTSLLTKSFNGWDLQRLYADSVLKDVGQQILAPKTFAAPVEFVDRVQLRYGLDALTADELKLNLLLHGEEPIEGDVEFTNDVVIRKELDIQSGIINDIDINQFVESILYENERKSMRIVNGSVRFKDVKVNNLVVGGKIQNIDLSREALLKNETHDAKMIREQQALINNQRLLNSHYGAGSSFQVQSNYRGADHQGTCYVHSCAQRETPVPLIPVSSPLQSPFPINPMIYHQERPPLVQLPNMSGRISQPGPLIQYPVPQFLGATTPMPPAIHTEHQQQQFLGPVDQTFSIRPPIKYVQQFFPNLLPVRPMSLFINNTGQQPQAIWRPNWEIYTHSIGPTLMPPNKTRPQPPYNGETKPIVQEHWDIIDPKLLNEHKTLMQAQAITNLAHRVNRFLSISFYYEIIQKHPLLGPLLHAAKNPDLNERGSSHLLLKGTSKLGEPCLQRGQTVAVMSQQRIRNSPTAFTQSSLLQETSNPSIVDSVVVEQTLTNYLFILDSHTENVGLSSLDSQVLIYSWDHQSGMYELKEKLIVDGFPTAMRAFSVNNVACIAVANPKLVGYSNHTGSPTLYCQESPASRFSLKLSLPNLSNVFDLDVVVVWPTSTQLIIASLSQQHTEQIGDLSVIVFDLFSRNWTQVALRRMVRPMKLHMFRESSVGRPYLSIKLAVSEAITSSDDTQAMTRIFELEIKQPLALGITRPITRIQDVMEFNEVQVLRDNQFYDIQSVRLDSMNSMLFFRSAHSISIYAPAEFCGQQQYSLILRLPTKGASKFLVFNDFRNQTNYHHHHQGTFDHFLVLSRDDCEQQHYTTLILKAKFR